MSNRGMLISAHIADLHFSAFDPKRQYEILKTQFVDVINQYPKLDIISIDGDIYHHKLMGNSDGLYYASLIVDDIMQVARTHNSTVVMIHGTYSHDADQLKNFYHYMQNYDVDVRIVTTLQFENIKNARILCIPELYGVDESIYSRYLHESGYYDEAFMHGTFKGAVYGDTVGNGRLFTPHDFDYCLGCMIGGHVHTPGCHSGYFYYTGSPYRWRFGEEEDKGFLIVVHDLDTQRHYVHFQKIISDTYITIEIGDIVKDPKEMIEYINRLKSERNIDYLKIKFTTPISGSDKVIIENYYRNNPYTFVEFLNMVEVRKYEQQKNGEVPEEYDFILDNQLSDIEKFVKYVNIKEGSNFITVDKLKEILEETI
jgi:DNA repair exonuclease SbcCD nuclease subunit